MRPLVEIVRADQTDEATIAAAVAYVIRIGKLPVVVRDSPGFLVNRLLFPYLNEALEMVCQGVDLEAIDRAGRAVRHGARSPRDARHDWRGHGDASRAHAVGSVSRAGLRSLRSSPDS